MRLYTLFLKMFMISWLLFQDVKVPVCPLCSQPVPVNRGEDPNIKVINDLETCTCAVITVFYCQVDEHIQKDCQSDKAKKVRLCE